MKPEVFEALEKNIPERRKRLQALSKSERLRLLEEMIHDFFVVQRSVLLRWSALTGQSAQIDTGNIAQHMASLVLAEPGQGFKGKGLDLADGSEVKSAAILSGVDRSRWNHNMGTPSGDENRKLRGLNPKWSSYLAAPRVFYVLFDRVPESADLFRVRAWCVEPKRHLAWTSLVKTFIGKRNSGRYNLQLHPPIGQADDLFVNTLGNLDLAEMKVFEAHFASAHDLADFEVDWKLKPSDNYKSGTCTALKYERSRDRRIEIEGAEGHVLPSMKEVRRLFRAFSNASGPKSETPDLPHL